MCDVCFRFILSVRLAEQLKKLDRDRWTINFLRFSFEEFDLYHHAARPRTNRNGEKKNRATKLPNEFFSPSRTDYSSGDDTRARLKKGKFTILRKEHPDIVSLFPDFRIQSIFRSLYKLSKRLEDDSTSCERTR